MSILHGTTDPTFLVRLKQMLGSSERAEIAVGYFFISGFDKAADEFAQLKKVRVLVGRTDRQVLEKVARGLQQAPALKRRLDDETTVRRRERPEVARQAVDHIAEGVAKLPQEQGTEAAVRQPGTSEVGISDRQVQSFELLPVLRYLKQ